jgi:hypothetical protein
MDDDYMITFDEETLIVYDGDQVEQVVVPHFTPVAYHIHDNIIMCASRQMFKVFDARSCQQVSDTV